MLTFDELQRPIAAEMKAFEPHFREAMRSKVALLDRVMHYIVKRKGKQMRPMFTLLSARQFGPVQESAFVAASLIELLHTATLVHDDLIDGPLLRRGTPTLNARWSPPATVLTGDFLFARAAKLAAATDHLALMKLFSETLATIVNGELTQMFTARAPAPPRG